MRLKAWVGGLCLAVSVGGHGLLLALPLPSATPAEEEVAVEEVPIEIMDVAVLPTASEDLIAPAESEPLSQPAPHVSRLSSRPPAPRFVAPPAESRATPAPVVQNAPAPPVEPPIVESPASEVPPQTVVDEPEVAPAPDPEPEPDAALAPEASEPDVTPEPEADPEPEPAADPEPMEPDTAAATEEPAEDPMPYADFPHTAGAQMVSCDGGGPCWRSPVEGSWRGAARSVTTNLESQGYEVADVTGQVLSIDTGVYVYAVQKAGEDPFYLNFVSVSGDVLYSMTTDPINTDTVRQLQSM